MQIQHFWEFQDYQLLMLQIWMHLFWKEQQLFSALHEFKPRAITQGINLLCHPSVTAIWDRCFKWKLPQDLGFTINLPYILISYPSNDPVRNYGSHLSKGSNTDASNWCPFLINQQSRKQISACLHHPIPFTWIFYGHGIDHILCMQSQTDYLFAPIYLLPRILVS